LDLERKDLIIREYEGYADSYERWGITNKGTGINSGILLG
jgi:hypothetical protein